MQDANLRRFHALRHYTERRHYEIRYNGPFLNTTASMGVDVTYDAPSTKTFRIVSQSGSKMLTKRVLNALLESEKEGARDPEQHALSSRNYIFHSLGEEVSGDNRYYVFEVEPRTENKFLYRGKIWIDANDYALARIEAVPSKNPSFWTKKTDIHHLYTKTGEFWLPKENRSETKIRTGGTAVLTIEYGPYKIESEPRPAAGLTTAARH